jgi:hypothetical protein
MKHNEVSIREHMRKYDVRFRMLLKLSFKIGIKCLPAVGDVWVVLKLLVANILLRGFRRLVLVEGEFIKADARLPVVTQKPEIG